MRGAALPPAAWWRDLRARAQRPPRTPRSGLWLPAQGALRCIGSLAPGLAERLAQPHRGEPAWIEPLHAGIASGAAPDASPDASPTDVTAGPAWCVRVPSEDRAALDEYLAALAAWLRDHGLSGPWRDELLAVEDDRGLRVAAIERGAVRPLGITTRAVHLAGRTPDGRHWIQQRSARKANDPGKLDTLMGGMISAADTLISALERETWEEAGLRMGALTQLQAVGRVSIDRPSSQAEGLGHVREHIDCYQAVLPADVEPSNQDGEVDAFFCMDEDELIARLVRDEFTLEAALVLGAALGWPRD